MKERDDNVLCLMQVTGKHGAKLREGIDLHSAEIACTSNGLDLAESAGDGRARKSPRRQRATAPPSACRSRTPRAGWISKRFLSPVEASSAAPAAIAEPVAPPPPTVTAPTAAPPTVAVPPTTAVPPPRVASRRAT